MICDECNKNIATFHFTQIINNKVSKVHLCDQCAEKITSNQNQVELVFAFPQFLAGMLNAAESNVGLEIDLLDDIESGHQACPDCKTTFNDIRETGLLGCGKCYEVFSNSIMSLIKQIQDDSQHLGKVPKNISEDIKIKVQLEEMQQKLKKHVDKEEYEQAAELRDDIRKLKTELAKEK